MTIIHKMTAVALLESFHALQQLGQKKLPPHPLAYRVGKAISAVGSIAKGIEKKRQALVREYGILTEDKKNIEVPADKMKDFEAAVQALMDSEVEVVVNTVEIEMFHEAIEPAILAPLLSWFIVESATVPKQAQVR